MLYLALGCAALLLLVWLTRGKPLLKRREWRFLAGALAIAALHGWVAWQLCTAAVRAQFNRRQA